MISGISDALASLRAADSLFTKVSLYSRPVWATPGGGGGVTSIIEGGGDVPLDRVWFSRLSILAQDI